MPFQLELVAPEYEQPNKLPVKYSVSSVVSSSFMFQFDNYFCNYNTADYPGTLVVSRNNEMPIYNSAYLNYLRTGYNYDVKAKNTQQTANWITTGIGIATTVGGIIIAATGAGAPLGAGMIVGGIGTIATGLTGTISGTIQAENNMQAKQAQLKAQGTSVSNCDDIDLCSIYTGNKPKIMLYKTSEQMTKLLADTFYYCGYLCNEQKVPNLNTRKYFNFISCNAVFNEETTSVYKDYLEDIKHRYSLGVTVYHKDNSGDYDWDQVKENLEVSIHI